MKKRKNGKAWNVIWIGASLCVMFLFRLAYIIHWSVDDGIVSVHDRYGGGVQSAEGVILLTGPIGVFFLVCGILELRRLRTGAEEDSSRAEDPTVASEE